MIIGKRRYNKIKKIRNARLEIWTKSNLPKIHKLTRYYIDIYQNKIDLSKLSLEELRNLDYQEETYFAEEIRKLKPFSKKRSYYMNNSYKKIFMISDWMEYRQKKAGIGKVTAIKSLLHYPINIYGCDTFLADEAKKIIKESETKILHIVQKNLSFCLLLSL